MAIQDQGQETKLEQLATLVFGLTRDVRYLLDHHYEPGPGQMGGETHHPTAAERASELQITLGDTVKLFGKNLQDYLEQTK
jgi:hypothetical protein